MHEFGAALPTLTTERLTLRAITPDDAPQLYEIFSDTRVTRYWSSPPLARETEAAELARQIETLFRHRVLFQWGLARRDDGALIGTCTLAAWSQAHRRAELGYALGHRHWGQGFMAEALPTVVAFGFGVMELHRLEADVDPRNAPSLRLLERLGFRREGVLRERYLQGGELQDAVAYGLLRREAEAQPALAERIGHFLLHRPR